MSRSVELPIVDPLYSTYHNQGPGTAVFHNNPTIRNWYLNEVMNLTCTRKFLNGSFSPEITVADSSWYVNPYLEKMWMTTQFAKGYINPIMREMLNQGYYIAFSGVDDYYVKGKTWYHQRHFSHDGLICGYNQDEKTYCIYAYDSNWVYRKFWTPQEAFNKGRVAMTKQGSVFKICGLRPTEERIDFSPTVTYARIQEYLDSDLDKYPFDGEGKVFGAVVHAYMAEYVAKLQRGEIPYERMDRRVFRVIWEQKRVMLERILSLECELDMDKAISERYKPLVDEADTMRMLYAWHRIKRRDSVLPIIGKKLLALMKNEREILTALLENMKKELGDEIVEVSET